MRRQNDCVFTHKLELNLLDTVLKVKQRINKFSQVVFLLGGRTCLFHL